LKFDRNELAGAFGDLGTFIPLVTALVIINGLDPKGIFLSFGLLYMYSGLVFGIPVPVQPMKAMASIMITEVLSPSLFFGAGLVVGVFFLILSITNGIELIHRLTPKSVVRGIQLGLGLNLILVAFKFMQKDYMIGWILSIVGVFVVSIFLKSRRFPSALLLLSIGIGFSIYNGFPLRIFAENINIAFPRSSLPTSADLVQGTLLLAIPQIPLTIGNAILATSLLSQDYFKEKNSASVRRLTFSHGFMNLVAVLLGGIPVCHGAGGLSGHYRFGARTGGAMIIIGVILAILGIFYGNAIVQALSLLPFSILGVLLFFSGLELSLTVKDVALNKGELFVALFVAGISIGVQYGYVLGLVGGVVLAHLIKNAAPKNNPHQAAPQKDKIGKQRNKITSD